MNRLWLDLETYCDLDLKKVGVYRYAADPSFEVLMASWSRDRRVYTSLGHDQITEHLGNAGLFDPEVYKVAHNTGFDRVALSAMVGLPPGSYLPPQQWVDTQAIAGERGWPQRLEHLGPALGGEHKDEAGTRLINFFSRPNRKGERNRPEDHPEKWAEFIAYCEQDVRTLIDVDDRLGGWHITNSEREVWVADQLINDRGIRIDTALAGQAVRAAEVNKTWQRETVTLLSGVENPSSHPQMMEWVRERGLPASDLQRETVDRLLNRSDLDPVDRVVLEMRRELALTASAKYTTALASVLPDDRLRGSFRYYGAHTGRWSGRGTQIQNLPSESLAEKDTPQPEADRINNEAAEALIRTGEASAKTLKALVRPMFLGPLTVVDYSAIEARVVAWLAGEQWALDAFAAGRDIYVETANRMGGLTRKQGKVAVLALGYNGGINSLKAMGGASVYYNPRTGKRLTGGALEAAGQSSEEISQREMTDGEYRSMVDQWRQTNPKIVNLWADLGYAFANGGPAGDKLYITTTEDRLGRAAHMWLPSGRAITYHGTAFEEYTFVDPATQKRSKKTSWRYADPRAPFNSKMRIGTYGGRLTENATQAVARDLLAAALVRLEKRGYRVVGHVHDEILVEGDHPVEEISAVMCESPDWAEGLPVDGAGFVCRRYMKD